MSPRRHCPLSVVPSDHSSHPESVPLSDPNLDQWPADCLRANLRDSTNRKQNSKPPVGSSGWPTRRPGMPPSPPGPHLPELSPKRQSAPPPATTHPHCSVEVPPQQ